MALLLNGSAGVVLVDVRGRVTEPVVIAVLVGLVADHTKNPAHNVDNGQLFGQGIGKAFADTADLAHELVLVRPFGVLDYLEEKVGGGDGAVLMASNLSSLEKTSQATAVSNLVT